MLHIRYATAGDIPFLSAAYSQPAINEFVGCADDGKIRASLANPDEAYLVALSKDVPVGFAHLRSIHGSDRSIELCRLAITEQNKGYGAAFLNLLKIEAFGPLKANRFWLDVFPRNAVARKVYLRSGFVEEGTLREVYFWDGKFESTIVMSILAREYGV